MKKQLFFAALAACFYSCSDSPMAYEPIKNDHSRSELQLSLKQASAYASLFYEGLSRNDSSYLAAHTRTGDGIGKVEYLVEGNDTLLYAVNYSGGNGYVILSGSNTSFPIVAHSGTGTFSFNDVNPDNPLYSLINSYKLRVKGELHDQSLTKQKYFDEWKDLGKDGYSYEVVLTNAEPKETRGRRRNSSGKKSIYPYTGKDLDAWHQDGGYNYYAEKGCPIGCPAIAIGMLMYDTSQRLTGSSNTTKPNFYYYDAFDITHRDSTDLARRLRQIADSIPGYSFRTDASGAHPDSISIGLRKLGYKNAKRVPYDFDLLYKNMCYTRTSYFGDNITCYRGILLGAIDPIRGGHIWFCDGYYEQSYTVRKKFLGMTIKTWTEYDDRIYMNWGFGRGNGWFCANDNFWSSFDAPYQGFWYQISMYVNLADYVYK